MKRRGFLQSLAGFVGLAVAPTISAKQKPTIVNPEPGVYINGKKVGLPTNVSECTTKTSALDFSHLTIEHFGAKDTSRLSTSTLCAEDGAITKKYMDHMANGITWLQPSDWFPQKAIGGHAFYFTPKTYLGYNLDPATINRLEGCYVYTETGWCYLLGLTKTQDVDWNQINQNPGLFPPAPHL